jgi:serine/threonine protein kinase
VSTTHLAPARAAQSTTHRAADEQRAFLQERTALFARASAGLAAFFYLALNLTASLNPRAEWRDWYAASYSVTLLVMGIVSGAVWGSLRGNARALSVVEACEAGFLLSVTGLMAWIAVASPSLQRPELSVITGVDLIMVLRAVFVPSRPRRTAVIGALAILPTVVCAFVAHRGEGGFPFLLPPVMYAAITFIWGLLGVITATLTSSVIYGLRRTMTQALRLGQYTLEDKIGEGGMGVVFRAKHALLRRPTAIKLLHPSVAGELGLTRFEREVQITSSLTHPSTVAIYDYGRTPAGLFYYAMEYVDGLTLEALTQRFGAQPAGRVIHILRQMCGALHEAHDKGLIHRDVKPANAILCERGGMGDVVKVLDFGLAKEIRAPDVASAGASEALQGNRSPGETQAGVISGTPHYMAPEAIATPTGVDARTDIYALGCVGYYLLTATTVFPDKSLSEVWAHHLRAAPEPPSSRLGGRATTGNDLERVILSCLAKDPAHRPSSARDLAGSLAACAQATEWSQAQANAWWESQRENLRPAPILSDDTVSIAPTLAVAYERTIDSSQT